MALTPLWTKRFIAIMMANGLFFVSFHSLLPTLPLYVASLGATGTEIGIIAGIFSLSSIGIRFFTEDVVHRLGKKNCLYLGILLSLAATISYPFITSIPLLTFGRIIQGLGFGLGTTFAAALAVDIIPASRRGEGVGFFGLGNTISMGLAPAAGVALLTGYGSTALFALATIAPALALLATYGTGPTQTVHHVPQQTLKLSLWHRFVEHGTGRPSFFTMLWGFAFGSTNTFIAMFAQAEQIPSSGLFFVVGTVLVFISRTFGGRLYDSKGPVYVLLPGIISYTLFLGFLLLGVHDLTTLLLSSVFYGLGGGLIMPALMTWLFNSVKPERRSNASATFYNMMDIGTSLGIIALGALSSFIGYSHIFYVVLLVMLLFLAAFIVQWLGHHLPNKTQA